MLEDVPGILIVNCCRRDELQEECLYGLFVCRVAFNLNGWCSGLMVVPYYLDISPNAMKGCIYVGAGPEDRLKLTGQCYSLDVGGGEMQPSTGSWKHAVVWVNNDEPVWVRGSEFRDEGCWQMLECTWMCACRVKKSCCSCLSRVAMLLFLR